VDYWERGVIVETDVRDEYVRTAANQNIDPEYVKMVSGLDYKVFGPLDGDNDEGDTLSDVGGLYDPSMLLPFQPSEGTYLLGIRT